MTEQKWKEISLQLKEHLESIMTIAKDNGIEMLNMYASTKYDHSVAHISDDEDIYDLSMWKDGVAYVEKNCNRYGKI